MKRNVLFALVTLGFALFFSSCTKMNEPTELGDELLPAVDNVNTFDTSFNVQASYHALNDSLKALYTDNQALGQINDPVFGSTKADMYFNLSSSVYSSYPFLDKSSLSIDSVVLSLAYAGAYGDTMAAVNVDVSEIASDNSELGFQDTVFYDYTHAGFPTVGSVLGSKSFSTAQFKDSVSIIRSTDTTKVANVLRIRLDNSLGTKLSQFDTAGGYKNDTLFRAAFRGLSVKTSSVSNPGALAYFSLSGTGSALYVYYRTKKSDGTDSLGTATFIHSSFNTTTAKNYGVANSVVRMPAGEYVTNLDKASAQQLYVQSTSSGSYVGIRVPALDTFPNKVIHRAELIVYKLPSTLEQTFTPPARLFLDHKSATDTAFLFDRDIQFDANNIPSYTLFGGSLQTNNSYHFNITRYVQGIVTRNERNDTLRLYAPLRNVDYATTFAQYYLASAVSNVAQGRVVVAGDSYPDPALRMQLRIVYSNL